MLREQSGKSWIPSREAHNGSGMARATTAEIERRGEGPRAEAPASGRPVTSYDVAKRAGVSQSAVSRCFTPGSSVSKATRSKIMQAVEELGYRPNAIARSLITQRSNMVAVIVANLAFHPEFTACLSRSFSDRGLHVLLFTMEHEADADRVVDQVWQYRVDGVIAAVRLPRRHIEAFAERRLPAVFINRLDTDIRINSVSCDQAEGERMLVDALIAAGHRRFGLVRGPVDSSVSVQRVESAVKRLHESGVDDIRFADGDFDYESGKRAMHALMRDGAPPDAVMCANDMMALGVMDAARHELGLAIPKDLSVVGFDGMRQARWSSYDLVTIGQPTSTMVEAAVEMLVARIENPALGTEKRVFSGELLQGGSARIA